MCKGRYAQMKRPPLPNSLCLDTNLAPSLSACHAYRLTDGLSPTCWSPSTVQYTDNRSTNRSTNIHKRIGGLHKAVDAIGSAAASFTSSRARQDRRSGGVNTTREMKGQAVGTPCPIGSAETRSARSQQQAQRWGRRRRRRGSTRGVYTMAQSRHTRRP